jgi:LysM repeat protein
MNRLKPVLTGMGSAFLMCFVVFGSFLLTLVENGDVTSSSGNQFPGGVIRLSTISLEGSGFDESLVTFTPTITFPPPPSDCPPPIAWIPKLVASGETLTIIARNFNTTTEELIQANCLDTPSITAGTVLYVPPVPPTSTSLPTATSTDKPRTDDSREDDSCGKPPGWVIYIVKPGDTLYRISILTGTSVSSLKRANCLGTSTIIHPGQNLYVPKQPGVSTKPTSTLTQVPPTRSTDQPTSTKIPSTPTVTPVPPTDTHTPQPPTVTPKPPTDTPPPPTNTPAPPSETPEPLPDT